MPTSYLDLLPYCQSDRQREVIKTASSMTTREAPKALGVTRRCMMAMIARIKKRAALAGYSPDHDMTRTVPEPFLVKGISSLYGKDGTLSAQWVKTKVDEEAAYRTLLAGLTDALEDYQGLSKLVTSPTSNEASLLAVYPLGDPHIGLYAWSEEAGEDFDTEIASANLRAAMRDLVSRSPAADNCLILNLGDFYHSDNIQNRTLRSGHVLDVDTRWAKVLRIGIDLLIDCVYAALEKHKTVTVKNITGNHDDHSAMFLAVALDKYFSNNERVTVDQSPSAHWYYRFGKVLIGSTHGDKSKPDSLPGIMAADKAKDWGDTEYRYWYTGHIHSRNMIEFPGVTWESFRTLAAKDAWHAAQGYRSLRDMQCIIHHRDYGEVGRNTVNVAMLRKK